MFQLLISHRILSCGMEKLVYLLLGASKVSTLLAAKQGPCEKDGVSYKCCTLPCSLPAPSPVPFSSPECHELPPKHVTELNKWWFLLLSGSPVMPGEGSELLSQLVDPFCSLVHSLRCFTDLLLLLSKALCPVAHNDCRQRLAGGCRHPPCTCLILFGQCPLQTAATRSIC